MIKNIKTNRKILGMASAIMFLFIGETIEAQVGHMHRATRRRTAVVVSSATHQKDQAAAQQSQAAAQQSQPATTEPPPATTNNNQPVPIGTVLSKLPEGCVANPVDNVQYYHCGVNYYRVVFQENNLVYVASEPPGTK